MLEMRDWVKTNGAPFKLGATKIVDPWEGVNSAEALSEEREFAYFATGNALVQRALPFQRVPVASSYEQSLGYLYYLLWTRYVSAGQAATKSINTTTLEALHPARLALLGVRYVIARDSPGYEAPALERVMGWHGYSVYAVKHPNLSGYGVGKLEVGDNLSHELMLMRAHGFSPRDTAVVPASTPEILHAAHFARWSPLARSSIALEPGALHLTAASAGVRSFIVLPFDWSSCWAPEWREGSGRLVRADVGLIGVAFEGQIDMRLRWAAGYGAASRCLVDDQAMIRAAKEAAAQVGFASAYGPLDNEAPPFAAARPFMASDVVEELDLRERPGYRSGEEVVIPARAASLLTADELDGKAWTTSGTSDFHAEGDGYALTARNGGGASLLVLPLRFSYCWQALWHGRPGLLVPVQSTRLGLIFRDGVSLTLTLPQRAEGATDCASRDKARQTVVEALQGADRTPEPTRYQLGHKIVFSDKGDGESYIREGWSQPEAFGTWSLGPLARLILRVTPPASGDLQLDAMVGALLIRSRREAHAVIAVNGVDVSEWDFQLDNTPGPRRLTIPRALLEDTGVLIIDFKVPAAVSPVELGEAVDKRKLALSFQTLSIRAAAGGGGSAQ